MSSVTYYYQSITAPDRVHSVRLPLRVRPQVVQRRQEPRPQPPPRGVRQGLPRPQARPGGIRLRQRLLAARTQEAEGVCGDAAPQHGDEGRVLEDAVGPQRADHRAAVVA